MMSKDAPVGCGVAAQYCSLSQQFDLATSSRQASASKSRRGAALTSPCIRSSNVKADHAPHCRSRPVRQIAQRPNCYCCGWESPQCLNGGYANGATWLGTIHGQAAWIRLRLAASSAREHPAGTRPSIGSSNKRPQLPGWGRFF
jgi:hypothetical protein